MKSIVKGMITNMKKIIALLLLVSLVVPTCSVSARLTENYKDYLNVDYVTYFKNVDTNISELKGVHPRIWLGNDDFERIRGYKDNEYKDLWGHIVKTADSYMVEPEEFRHEGENNWMKDQAQRLITLIFTYKISGDKKYKEVIDKTIDAMCEYPSWANKPTAHNIHLAGAYNWAAFGLYYDWCYDEIDPERKIRMVESIAKRVEDYNIATDYGWGTLSCHNIAVSIAGGVMVALGAMYEEIPNAEKYMKRLTAEMATVSLACMPDDGALYENANYTGMTWRGLLWGLITARDILNVDLISHPTFNAAAKFMTYTHIPYEGWASGEDVFGWGDGTASSGGIFLSVLTYMARERQNPVYKYFVDKYVENTIAKNTKNDQIIYALMFADANLEGKSPAEFQDNKNGDIYYPLDFLTDDTDYVFLRDSWDGNAASLEFHCGPVIGKTAADYRKVVNRGLGVGAHQHPDLGSLLLFAEGEWIFQDDGYTTGTTANHNCLLINGIGQISDKAYDTVPTRLFGLPGRQTPTIIEPGVIKMESFGDMTYVICDLTKGYPDYHYYDLNTGLEKYYRHYVYLKPEKTILVIDEIKTMDESDFEIRWRPAVQVASRQVDGSYVYTGKNYNMRLESFELEDSVSVTNSNVVVVSGKSGGTKEAYIMQIKNRASEWNQVSAITWENINGPSPINTSVKEENGIYTFSLDDGVLVFDLENQKIERIKSEADINLKVDDNIIFPEDNIISKDYVSYLPVDEIVKSLGLKKEDNIISNKDLSTDITKLTKSFTENGKTYVSIRELCDNLKMCLWWEEGANCINIDTDADISEAEVYALSVNGNVIAPDENGNYSIELFSDNIIIDVTTTVQGTTIEREMTENGFGENKVKIISQDKTNVKEFTVTVNPKTTQGKYPIYNITSQASITDMKSLVDGDMQTAWAIENSGEAIFDLGDLVELNSVSIAFLKGATRKQIFGIYISEDGNEYKEIFNGKASGKTTDFETYEIKDKARFVKITLGGHTNGGGWNNTSEIKFD